MNKFLQQALEKNKQNGYLLYHAPRYEALLALLHRYYRENASILDIGRSPFTVIASESLGAPIDTLGFEPDRETETGYNYQFDLNQAQETETWRTGLPRYDIIVFSEVIEHLHTSPSLVLAFLKSLLTENGILIVQTPNAVVAHKRLLMLLGRNPFSLISENARNPAHFREYTAVELTRYFRQAGFAVERRTFENYFDYRYTLHGSGFSEKKSLRLVNFIYRVLPPSLRPGLCFVIRQES